jgi:hypothetical protein
LRPLAEVYFCIKNVFAFFRGGSTGQMHLQLSKLETIFMKSSHPLVKKLNDFIQKGLEEGALSVTIEKF